MKTRNLLFVAMACMGLLSPVHAAVLKVETPNTQLVLDATEGQQLALLYYGDKSATLDDIYVVPCLIIYTHGDGLKFVAQSDTDGGCLAFDFRLLTFDYQVQRQVTIGMLHLQGRQVNHINVAKSGIRR